MAAQQDSGPQDRQLRKAYLIDRRFQLTYTSMVVGAAAVVAVVLGWIAIDLLGDNAALLQLSTLDPSFEGAVNSSDRYNIALIACVLALFFAALVAGTILVTHRMISPIRIMRSCVATIAEGRLPRMRPLRRRDEFVELYAELADAVATLEMRTREDLESLRRAQAALGPEGAGDPDQARHELGQLVARKERMLEASAP